MKNLIVLFGVLCISISVFAGGATCSVNDTKAKGEMVLEKESDNTDNQGRVWAQVFFRGERSYNACITVLVYCYDALTDQKVAVESVENCGNGSSAAKFYNLKPKHSYYFRLEEAHCQ